MRYHQINYNWFNEPFAVSQYKVFILRHAWLNLWDKHMTTGRINQVTIKKKVHKPESLIVFFLSATMILENQIMKVQAKEKNKKANFFFSLFSCSSLHYGFLVQLCNLEHPFDHRVLSESTHSSSDCVSNQSVTESSWAETQKNLQSRINRHLK